MLHLICVFFFFFNDTATTEIYTLSLHDALPISPNFQRFVLYNLAAVTGLVIAAIRGDRKSTRLNSSHANISYAVFCLKKKKQATNGRRNLPQPAPVAHRQHA